MARAQLHCVFYCTSPVQHAHKGISCIPFLYCSPNKALGLFCWHWLHVQASFSVDLSLNIQHKASICTSCYVSYQMIWQGCPNTPLEKSPWNCWHSHTLLQAVYQPRKSSSAEWLCSHWSSGSGQPGWSPAPNVHSWCRELSRMTLSFHWHAWDPESQSHIHTQDEKAVSISGRICSA